MNYYSVMLVDDEEDVRQSIIRKINWEEIGFKVIDSAENGEEALEKAERLCPDVVMTDIHMPFMDGLTFCKKLKKKVAGTKIIIFSGYDDFEYAKTAIKLEAEEYILKPIDSEELYQVFVRLKKRLDDEISQKRSVARLETYYRESEPLLKEQFYINLLDGRFETSQMKDFLNLYDIDFSAPLYSVGIIKICDDESTLPAGIKSNLLPLSLMAVAKENLERNFKCKILNYLGRVVVIVRLNSREEESDFVHEMDQVCKLCAKFLEIQVTAGVGQAYENLEDIKNSYAQAETAMDYRVLLKPNQAIFIRDVEPNTEERFIIHDIDMQMLVKAIKVGTEEELSEEVEKLVTQMTRTGISMLQLQNSYIELWSEILRLAKIYELKLEELDGLSGNFNEFIKAMGTLDSIKKWLHTVSLQIRNKIRKERKSNTQLLIDKAKEYIEENYRDCELSVEKVCSYLGLSATYFSTLFKRETGNSFVVYLTQVRMEKALHLLNTTDEKAYIISELVGYTEPNYFSYVFKKQYGVSPSKYRMKE